MRRTSLRIAPVLLVLLVSLFLVDCSKKVTGIIDGHGYPETELTYAPLEGDTASFRVHLYWTGHDVDGEVVLFRFAVDRDTLRPFSEWASTTGHDSILTFSVSEGNLTGRHVFWIVAEDNDGGFDPTPAKRFFSIRTVPPTSQIVSGPPGGVHTGPSVAFGWSGRDPDGGPTGGPIPAGTFEYLLLRPGTAFDAGHPPLPAFGLSFVNMLREAVGGSLPPPYDDWKWTRTSETTHRFAGLPSGVHVFAIRAVDAAGARDTSLALTTNIRYFIVSEGPTTGPLSLSLTITSPALVQPIRVYSPRPDYIPVLGVLEGDALAFAWVGDSGESSGPIAGYSVALDDTSTASWDVVDPRLLSTVLPHDLLPGPHWLFVRVVNAEGMTALSVLRINVVHAVFREPQGSPNPPSILFVDDFAPPPGDWNTALRGSPNFPTDAVEDEWWQRVILTPLAREFGYLYEEWDAVRFGHISFEGRTMPGLEELARYRVVICYSDLTNTITSPTALWRAVAGGSWSPLAAYVRGGGTLIVTGFNLANQTSGRSEVPYGNFERGMCMAGDPGSLNWRLSYFAREFLGLDAALGSDQGRRLLGARDFVEARVTTEATSLGFQTAEVDTGGPGTSAKWNPYVFSGSDQDTRLAPGLPKVDGWRLADPFACLPDQSRLRRENPGAPIAVPIFTYHGVDKGVLQDGGPSPREGLVVGIATQAHDMGQADGSVVTPGSSRGVMGRMVFLGFPIYYAKDEQAYAVMRAAFAYVNSSPTLPAGVP